ncbi:transglutaminase [Halobacteriales archaeon SW_7_68_16]|nr:MAG: transglutaminase [Halobacteriales archaeon SW_7_68_16]
MRYSERRHGGDVGDGTALVGGVRLAALAAVLVAIGSYVAVLYRIGSIVAVGDRLLAVTLGAIVVATVVAPRVRAPVAVVIGLIVGATGYGTYLVVAGVPLAVLPGVADELLADGIALLTGLSLLRIVALDWWVLGFVPAPTLLAWILAVRRQYARAALIAGAALGVLVLTGDAGTVPTLVGVLAGIAAVGFGGLDRRGGSILQIDVIVTVIAVAVVLALFVLPTGGAGSPLFVDGEGDTIETALTSSSDRVPIQGDVRLSPGVRFVVESDRSAYWRTGIYDRYTGQGWIRTGQSRPYDGRLARPPGSRTIVDQRIDPRSQLRLLPAAATPVSLDDTVAGRTVVTGVGGIRPTTAIGLTEEYTVRSAVSTASVARLRGAGEEYPRAIVDRYTQLPAVSDRLRERTAAVTADADGPYETARAIERSLERTKAYSLSVDRPDGEIADAFLFEMEAGYCTYFATTMVTMLRSAGVPARFVTGYTPGQPVDDDTYVVRGLDSHAWVEVYVSGDGWVRFDPTPASARRTAEIDRVERARRSDEPGTRRAVDVPESRGDTLAPPETDGSDPATGNGSAAGDVRDPRSALIVDEPTVGDGSTTPDPTPTDDGTGTTDGPAPSLPPPRDLAVGGLVLVGAVAGARRTGVSRRIRGAARLHWQRRRDPATDVERAWQRLERLGEREFRGRRSGETPREYARRLSLSALDGRARDLAAIYERAQYAEDVDRDRSDEAIALVDGLVRDRTPIVRRLRDGR